MSRTRSEFDADMRAVNEWWSGRTAQERIVLAVYAFAEGMPREFVEELVRAVEHPHRWKHDAYRLTHASGEVRA